MSRKVVHASDNEKLAANMTDVRDRRGAKTRVGKFVHFSGNASPPRGDKMTGDRQDTAATRQLLCDRVLPIAFLRPEMPTVRLIWPSSPLSPPGLCRHFYTSLALLLSQFPAKPGQKLLMPALPGGSRNFDVLRD